MARSILAVTLGLGLLFSGFAGTSAMAQPTETLGGTGGSASELPCRSGELLIGIGARFGDVLDWIGPMCVAPDRDLHWAGVPDGGIYIPPAKTSVWEDIGAFYSDVLPWNIPSSLAAAFAPSPTPRPGMGTSSGGSWTSYALCPQDTYVSGYDATVAGSGTGMVARITLRCSGPGGAASVGLAPPPANAAPPYYPTSGPDCPIGQLANGLGGMSGVFVDRIGLLCVQKPGEFRRAMRSSVLRAIQADARREGIAQAARRPDLVAPRPAIGPNARQITAAVGSSSGPSRLSQDARSMATAGSGPQIFNQPRTPDGARLNACRRLDQPACGSADVARQYCLGRQSSAASDFQLEQGSIPSETITGQRCTSACHVFVSISCRRP